MKLYLYSFKDKMLDRFLCPQFASDDPDTFVENVRSQILKGDLSKINADLEYTDVYYLGYFDNISGEHAPEKLLLVSLDQFFNSRRQIDALKKQDGEANE